MRCTSNTAFLLRQCVKLRSVEQTLQLSRSAPLQLVRATTQQMGTVPVSDSASSGSFKSTLRCGFARILATVEPLADERRAHEVVIAQEQHREADREDEGVLDAPVQRPVAHPHGERSEERRVGKE